MDGVERGPAGDERPGPVKVRILKDTKANAVWNAGNPDGPVVLYEEFAEVTVCGCKVVVGKRTDTWEAATVACPCGEAHLHGPIADFQRRLMASLDEPKNVPAIEVIRDLLEEAFA